MSSPAENPRSPRADTASAARFSVSGTPTPCFAPRVLELFAKRGLVPNEINARTSGRRQHIEIRIDGMSPDLAAYIGRCLRQIVSAERVLVSREERPDDA